MSNTKSNFHPALDLTAARELNTRFSVLPGNNIKPVKGKFGSCKGQERRNSQERWDRESTCDFKRRRDELRAADEMSYFDRFGAHVDEPRARKRSRGGRTTERRGSLLRVSHEVIVFVKSKVRGRQQVRKVCVLYRDGVAMCS